MQRVLSYVAAAAILWLAGIEVLLDGRRAAVDARIAAELAAETTRARAASLLDARSAALQSELARLQRTATPSGEVVSTLGSLMDGKPPVILTDNGGRIIALSAGTPALSPAAARTALAKPVMWTNNGSGLLLLALPLWTAHEELYVLTMESADRLIARAAPAAAGSGTTLAWSAAGPETPSVSADFGSFGLGRFTGFVPWGEMVVKRPLGDSGGFVVATTSTRVLLLQWLYHALMLAVIALLLLSLVWFSARHGRRLTSRYLERLDSLSRSSAEFIKLTDRGALLRAVEKRANQLVPHARIRVIPAGRAKLGTKPDFPIHKASGAAAAYMMVESRRGALGRTDAAMLTELAHRASGALDNIDLLESRDRAVVAAEGHLREVEEAKRRIEVIFAAMSDAVLALDAGMRVSYANHNTDALFGKSREALIGSTLASFWPAESLETLTASIAGAAMGGTVSFRSVWPMPGAQTSGWVSVRVFPYEDGFAIYLNEITGQVESEDKALQTTRAEAIGHLTGGVAHDFNNLLTVVLGNLELATLEALAPEVETLLLEAHHAAESAADLVRQLLAFARRQPLAPKVVDVGVLTAGVAGMLRRTLGATIAVEVQFNDSPRAVVDPNQLETAILNLALNARDAMPAGGRLSIELDGVSLSAVEAADLDVPAGDYVRLKVADTGAGIAPAHLPKIFDPFFTTKPVGRGTGLGLSMVYGFVRQSGGAISVTSQPGLGTTFSLLLPAEAPVPADTRQLPAPEIADLPTGTETILLVEDSLQVRSYACACLRGLGYAIFDFGDAAAAVAAVDDGLVPDLLLSDVVLPGGTDGTALAQILRRKLPDLPVLFMSAYADLDTVVSQRLFPGENLLPKPFRRDELAIRVRNCINHAQFGESDCATA